MTLLPFYGVGLPGQVISCQPWVLLYTKTITLFDHYETYKQGWAKKRKCLVSGYPTDPNILGPTQTFLKTFWDIKVYF